MPGSLLDREAGCPLSVFPSPGELYCRWFATTEFHSTSLTSFPLVYDLCFLFFRRCWVVGYTHPSNLATFYIESDTVMVA